jgi:quinol monooxygenase YgiN
MNEAEPNGQAKNASRLILLFLVRVRPAKRAELILSVRGLAPKERDACTGFAILQSVDDNDLIYIVNQWESLEGCRRYLDSESFRALRGAAGVLGTYSEWRIVTDAPEWHPANI